MAEIKLRLDKKEKEAFKEICKQRGTTMSDELRRYIYKEVYNYIYKEANDARSNQ